MGKGLTSTDIDLIFAKVSVCVCVDASMHAGCPAHVCAGAQLGAAVAWAVVATNWAAVVLPSIACWPSGWVWCPQCRKSQRH